MKSNLKFFKKSKKLPIDKFFMNVLYDNKFGYYASKQPFGLTGDFTTAPKISIVFSEIIAIWIISVWEKLDKPEKFNIIELGPGDGSLTKVLLRTFKKFPEFNSAKKILHNAIELGGTTIKNFIVSNEKIGYFKNKLNVYGRENLPCTICGKKSRILKIVQSGRSTFYCSKCQK